ncbi:STAS domain-containing protein [Candidatus Marimicrobium litorale]|jgi:rsbT co-antagonist protein RsbR|uniref:STAS domain-containing protein n=1 Tax=Candidatus Marimicrobium litorale TaxID=2518991 RepID=A0ABT3T916_9GAMM|nr:STAS domain-containing protein [Candidatus Marimicrobium litorale]MCX2978777.1 STAS domain-containing protein [Candidatus Marimicrobium litorale]
MKKMASSSNSTPVNELWDGILLLSVFGTVDSARSKEMMDAMLAKVVQTSAKVIVLDILGVAVVDSAVANHFLKIGRATKLIGADTIISGISPEVAVTLVELGIDLETTTTTGSLSDALSLAFEKTGYVIETSK